MLSVLGGMARSSAAAVWAQQHAEATTAAAAAMLERRQAEAAAAAAAAEAEAARLAHECEEGDASVQQAQGDGEASAEFTTSPGQLWQGQQLHGTGGAGMSVSRPPAVPSIPMQRLVHKQQTGAANVRSSGDTGSPPMDSERQQEQRQKQELADRWEALQPRLPAATKAAPVRLVGPGE